MTAAEGILSLLGESSQLDPSSSRSFTTLSTLSLPNPHVLHPQSCNPAMDLVVLLAPTQPGPIAPADIKGKGRASVPDMSSWRGTKVALWRMLGSKVWEVEVRGWVAGLAWSGDGLYLSLLVIMSSARKAVLEHRSVHTGGEIKVVPLDLPDEVWEKGLTGEGINMEWIENDLKWAEPSDGSARHIIASLPKVTPVEPPKPAVNNPFAKASAASTSKLPHSKLSTFPSLLSSTPSLPPLTLQVSLPHRRLRLLTGSFPCSAELSAAHLRLGQSADLLSSFLNTVLRGLEAVEASWRESFKQTMLWREELEECGKLQGMPVRDVHADLFRLLMTGRCREAVSEWLGNKLTGRMLTKWEQVLTASFHTIQAVIVESISPAVERVMILLQELRGWSRSRLHSTQLNLSPEGVDQCVDLTGGLIKLVERIRQDAEHEALAAAAWFAWLKYETAQAGSGGGDEQPTATHDLKLTWSFLVNGFVRSVFSTYFPDNTPTRPPTDELSESCISNLGVKPTPVPLDKVLAETLSRLSGKPKRADLQSPDIDTGEGMSLDQSSMMLSSGDESKAMEESGVDLDAEVEVEVLDEDEVIESDDESTGTAGKRGQGEEEKEVPRVLELEPWVWTNTLIKATEGLIRAGTSAGEDDKAGDGEGLAGMTTVWRSGEELWGASISLGGDHDSILLLIREKPTRAGAFLTAQPGSKFLALQFFDALELALVVDTPEGRYLTTIDYPSLVDRMLPLDAGPIDFHTIALPPTPIAYRRCRFLGPPLVPTGEAVSVALALNGRKGRRVGCVMGVKEGGEVEVWDMEADEGEEEEEEEEDGDGDGPEDDSM